MDTKISCEDGLCVRNIRNASGGANLVPAAAVIPDPGPYVAAGTVKAFDCSCTIRIMSIALAIVMPYPCPINKVVALHCAPCMSGCIFQHKTRV